MEELNYPAGAFFYEKKAVQAELIQPDTVKYVVFYTAKCIKYIQKRTGNDASLTTALQYVNALRIIFRVLWRSKEY